MYPEFALEEERWEHLNHGLAEEAGADTEYQHHRECSMNITSARNVSEFVHVLARDSEGRPSRLIVPGHEGRRYDVVLERNGRLQAACTLDTGRPFEACKGNSHCVCYHVLAACLAVAEEQGKELSWCESQADAERLSNIDGKVFTVKSAQSGKVAYGVVRDTEPYLTKEDMAAEIAVLSIPEQTPIGLDKKTLVKIAVARTHDKQQWHHGESLRLAPDAFLKNEDGFVRLYHSDKSGKFPKVTRLATVFWLDPGNIEAGWQRYTEARQAFDELYPDRDSALPAQRTRRNRLFKT